MPDAARQLAGKFAILTRQAYGYLTQARQLRTPVPLPDAKEVLFVHLSRSLIRRLRDCSAATGTAVSELVGQAL